MTKKELLDLCAQDDQERVLLARAMDKLAQTQQRGAPAHTPFLSPQSRLCLGHLLRLYGPVRHLFDGGYTGAERVICRFLPDWQQDDDALHDPDGPLAALEVQYPASAALSHRDILGGLMGLGLTREKLGDILFPGEGVCQIVALRECLPILLSQWESAGRYPLCAKEIPLSELSDRPPEVKTIRDTVATPRLDAVVSAGFSLSRSKAAGLITSGKVSVNHQQALKSDRTVASGDVISCRGLGKCLVRDMPGHSKKGRTMLVIDRYL